MKNWMKYLSLALVLVMACGCMALAEEDTDYAELYPQSLVYNSDWACGGTLIELICEDGGFRATVTQHTGEMLDEQLIWTYSPSYDPETGALVAPVFGEKVHAYPGDENDGTRVMEYEDGAARFVLLDNGHLIWNDEKEDAGAGMEFVKIGRFQGDYVCDRAQISISWDAEDVYVIDIHWAESAMVSHDWSLKGTYKAETNTLEASGMASVTTYDENGEFVSVECVNEEEGCFASFSFNEEYQLIWDSSDGAGDGLVFENQLYAF